MRNNRIGKELKNILEKNYLNWRGLYRSMLDIQNDENHAIAGFIMEYISKGFFINEGHYKNVWLFNEIPNKIRNRLLLTDKDNGVDLVLEGKNNKYYGVQVKFRKNENSTLSWSKDKLSNLVGHRKFNGHIVFSNTAEVCKVTSTQAKDLQKILITDLLELDQNNLDSIVNILRGKSKKKRAGARPYPHQRKAIDAIKDGFQNEKRGQLILPCRAGKTITSLILKEELKSHRTIVLVPTLTLLRQFKNEWLSFRNKDFEYFCVCSDKDVDANDISTISDIGQTGLGVSTDSNTIKGYLKTKSPMVVFTTYQSLPKVCEAVKDSDIVFDLALCDEAHKTAGAKEGLFSTIHFDKNIKVKKRLYMTATPKVSSGAISKNEMMYIADMSNEAIYGKELYRMSFREAIDIGIISDYQIYACVVTDLEAATHIQERTFTKDGDAEFVASCIAVGKAMKKFSLSNIISFHSSIKRSINFIDLYKDIYIDSNVYNVNSGISTGKRALKLEEFSETPNSLMSNAKCLTEGITVKSVDAVAFADPKYSVIDIVQGASRCLNKKEDNKKGIIIVPIFVATGENMESSIDKGAFKKLVKVLRAMSDHDEDLKEEIVGVRFSEGERNLGRTGGSTIKIGKGTIIIDVESLRNEINQSIIFDEIEKITYQSTMGWDVFYKLTKNFSEENQRLPYQREMYMGKRIGVWCAEQRRNFNKGKLDILKQKKLREINFVFDDLDDHRWNIFFKNFEEYFKKEKKMPGRSTIYKNKKIGSWVSDQIKRKNKKKLSIEREKKLKKIGFIFSNFDLYVDLVCEYKKETGNFPVKEAIYKGYNIGNWCRSRRGDYRKGKLDKKKIQKLLDIGFVFDKKHDVQWEKMYNIMKIFLEEKGREPINVEKYKGENLGYWGQKQRTYYRKGDLSKYRIDKLKKIGFILINKNDMRWDIMYEGVVSFVEKNGRAPNSKDKYNELNIGDWVQKQKKAYRRKELKKERVFLLKKINILL